MKPTLVVFGIVDGPPEPDDGLIPEDCCGDEPLAIQMVFLAEGQNHGPDRRTRMQGGGILHIVQLIGLHEGPVCQGRVLLEKPLWSPDHGTISRHIETLDVFEHCPAGIRKGPVGRRADEIEPQFLNILDHLSWQVIICEPQTKIYVVAGDTHWDSLISRFRKVIFSPCRALVHVDTYLFFNCAYPASVRGGPLTPKTTSSSFPIFSME